MKPKYFRLSWYGIITYLTFSTLNPTVAVANLNVGEPRTVRLIYFLPNGDPYRTDVVQKMKDEIRIVQALYAEQMGAHGYGKVTFRVETDLQGEPMVHRVDGQHPDSYYLGNGSPVTEIGQVFDLDANIYIILVGRDMTVGGHVFGVRSGKNGGYAVLNREVYWAVLAHELGHAFGLRHDFRNDEYIMSYGLSPYRLSACSAEFLTVHPYFNHDIEDKETQKSRVELMSPRTYSVNSNSIPVQLKVSDSDGLHQVFLHVEQPNNRTTVKACRELAGEKDAIVQFDYDGVIPSSHDPSYSRSTSFFNPLIHPISVTAVDIFGNLSGAHFILFPETLQPLTKISGDYQHGLPNAPLPVPFAVDVRDVNDGSGHQGVWVTFTVTAGGGTLSVERVMTDFHGRAESTLTLGPNLGANTVEVSAEGITVIFNAVADNIMVSIPDPNLRAAIEKILKKTPGTSITPAEMATLTKFSVYHASISNLTGLESATNLRLLALERNLVSDISHLAGLTQLTRLSLERNSISDISAVAGLNDLRHLNLYNNNISDISAVAGLTHLTSLGLDGNNILDISAVAGLTNLTYLNLYNNNISDISAVAGLNDLTFLDLLGNFVSDLSPLVANTGLEGGDTVDVRGNPLSYPSLNTHIPTLQSRGVRVGFDTRTPTTLESVSGNNQQGVPGVPLTNPFVVEVKDQHSKAFEGVPVTFTVTAGGGTLRVRSTTTDVNGRAKSTLTLGSEAGTNTVSVSVADIEGAETFTAIGGIEFDLSVPAGINLIHIPLKVTAVNGIPKTIESISDLYDALGGINTVELLITHDSKTQQWNSYLGDQNKGGVADKALTDDLGIIASMKAPVSIRLSGDPLGKNGESDFTLRPGINLVGIPLRDSRITHVSDLLNLEGIAGNVSVIIASDSGQFKVVARAGDEGDIPLTGGQAFILTAFETAPVAISGTGWSLILDENRNR